MQQGPPPAVTDRWETLREDATATAAEYDADGWTVHRVETGEVTPLSGTPFGLDVLVPGDDFERASELVEAASFDTSHVYRAEERGVRFLIIVVEASDDEVAVVVPAYLSASDTEALAERAREEGVMYTHLRPLSDEARVTFSHEDPELFF
ncbi:DUF7529 family protein [Natronomonas pharaonis]|nr:hypothetical protein [Natronomonas pharaonis]